MIHQYRQLVDDIVQQTGVDRPPLLHDDAPLLDQSALRQDDAVYLIGLIGGKEVGKSTLVNALVGQEITPRSSGGPGTEIAVAYAHQDHVQTLNALLEAQIPGRYRIVTHNVAQLRRQVLLDLPDIDSHYERHNETTRRMLRHMLFPLFLQSVEKYADQRPQQLLAVVSAGNAPRNFIFCLNKVDQVAGPESEAAVREIGQDYGQRVARQLNLPQAPRVWLISAAHPDRYDLPALRAMLARERSQEAIRVSQHWAMHRQAESLNDWVVEQDLKQRLAALDRLENAAEEELASRVGVPLIDSVIPRLLDDPAHRMALADELMQQRVKRWPIVSIINLLVGPLLGVLRVRWSAVHGLGAADELVQTRLRDLGGGGASPSLAASLQSAFASLQQSFPPVGRLYGDRKLWEAAPAEHAAAKLHQRLAATIERQRAVIRSGLRSWGVLGAAIRLLLTFGAVVWFPFAQPILEAWIKGASGVALLAVQVLGVSYLIKNVVFLAIYFILLWLILRWCEQRRVDRALQRWRSTDTLDPALSLAGQVVQWSADLLEPIHTARQKMADLTLRAEELRNRLDQTRPSPDDRDQP